MQPAALALGLLLAVPGPELTPADAPRVLEEVSRPGAKAVLVNVWATWCVPCREEFPDLLRVAKEYRDRGLRLVLVSADFDDAIAQARDFLAERGVNDRVFLKHQGDQEFIDGLEPRWSGALPATIVFDGRGRRVWFHEGKSDYEQFKTEVERALAATAAGAAGRTSP